MKSTFFYFLLITGTLLIAQETGKIRGTVLSETYGDALQDVQILIDNEEAGLTDLDGAFSISISPGTYTLVFSDIMHEEVTVENVIVRSGVVSNIGQILLPDFGQKGTVGLAEVIVVAKSTNNSERAMLALKKNSTVMLDGITAEKMKLTGDGNAVAAAQRVTGVSVEGGKYVYIRGLGDRYSKTMLNEIDIPGLDPDRNTLQMDIFPSSLLENMMVSKNFAADLPADFTGGMLNIETLSFPTKKFLNVSAGFGFNPDMHFNSNFLTYDGGQFDWLGFDDGTREIPQAALGSNIPSPANPNNNSPLAVNDFLNQLDKTLGAEKSTSLMNSDLSISLGNQMDFNNGNNFGYIFSLTYKNDYQYFENYQLGEYQRSPDSSQNQLIYATRTTGSMGEQNALLGILGGFSYKTDKSRYRLTAMHLQNGTKKAAQLNIDNSADAPGQSGFRAFSNNLEFNQSALTNILLNGVHKFKDSNLEIDWRISPTISSSDDPDLRKTAFTYQSSGSVFNAGAGGNPSRIWRYLDEFNGVGKFDIIKGYKGNSAKLKFGARGVYKQRDFNIVQLDMQFFGSQPRAYWEQINYDPNQILDNQVLYPNGTIYYSSGNSDPNPNFFEANNMTAAVYISNEINVLPKLKTILGLRAENYEMRYTGSDQQGTLRLDNEKVIESFGLYPSANLIYSATDNMNVRASYGRTTARPSFKEASYAQILDPVSNRIFNGGFYPIDSWDGNLQATMIDNFDFRWEIFPSNGELFSVSAFYKAFDKPIELVRITRSATSNEFQPQNVGDGTVLGAEVEIRKNLGFIAAALENLSLSANVTYTESHIDLNDAQLRQRQDFARYGETIESYRDMAGQSPFVVNAGLMYSNPENYTDTGLFYHVKGETLSVVGTGLYPDVYTQPFHSLNFTFNKRFGKEQNSAFSIKIENLLDAKTQDLYRSYQTDGEIFELYETGRLISIGFSQNL